MKGEFHKLDIMHHHSVRLNTTVDDMPNFVIKARVLQAEAY